MAVGLNFPEKPIPVAGLRLSATHCGLKSNPEFSDLVLIELDAGSSVSAVFTRNRFRAAPVVIAQQHLNGDNPPRYLLINSGNANAGTGEQGLQNALKCCRYVADFCGESVESVMPFSTGVIGQQLAVVKIADAVPTLFDHLDVNGWMDAAQGIMTTDTLPKVISQQVEIEGKTVAITGMCKGAGMIRPDMATMLAYIATDAKISQADLSNCLRSVIDSSFNAITVDGDTSTNDACVLMATGASGVVLNAEHETFMDALQNVFTSLAQAIVRDGEGATKFVEVKVENALSLSDAREIAYTIAHSPLVKTALFASDANWGRILAAVGRAPVDSLDIDRIDLFLGEVCLIKNGLPHTDYSEEKGSAEMSREDILIRVRVNQGDFTTSVWTTDLSHDYVRINAEYRT